MAYLFPNSMADAFAALERGDVSVIAGGTDWFPQAGEVLPKVSLLDVTGLPGFRGISKVPGGWRLAVAEFVTGVRRTAGPADELVSAVFVPDLAAGTVAGFHKLGARRYLVISIAMVAASLRVEAGRILDARVAVGACSPVARRLTVLEARLLGLSVAADLSMDVTDLVGLEPISDVRGSGEYRLEAVVETVFRLLCDLVQQGVRADG